MYYLEYLFTYSYRMQSVHYNRKQKQYPLLKEKQMR